MARFLMAAAACGVIPIRAAAFFLFVADSMLIAQLQVICFTIALDCVMIAVKERDIMSTATKSLNLRVDAELKAKAEHIFSELGLPTSTAITMFLKSVVRHGGIPFELRVKESPNAKTLKAMDDVNNKRNLVGPFNSVDEVMEELDV